MCLGDVYIGAGYPVIFATFEVDLPVCSLREVVCLGFGLFCVRRRLKLSNNRVGGPSYQG